MRPLPLSLLVLSITSGAYAQDAAVPDPYNLAPSAASAPPVHEEAVSDADVIRWASRTVGITDDRDPDLRRPPLPPDGYLERSVADSDGGPPLALAGEDERALLRLLAEIGIGAVGVTVGGALGTLILWGAQEEGADGTWMLVAGASGVLLTSFGVSLGVALAGDLTEGRGNFGDAFLGELVGALIAIPFVYAGIRYDAVAASYVAAGVLPLAGAIIGYEIGHGSRSGSGSSSPSVFVAPQPGGVYAGLAGSL